LKKLQNRKEEQLREEEVASKELYVVEKFSEGHLMHKKVHGREAMHVLELGSDEQSFGPTNDMDTVDEWIERRHQLLAAKQQQQQEAEQQFFLSLPPPTVAAEQQQERKPASSYKKTLIDPEESTQLRRDDAVQDRANKKNAAMWLRRNYHSLLQDPAIVPFMAGEQQVWEDCQEGGDGGQAGSVEEEFETMEFYDQK
jgi:hypothetical protein